MDEQKRARFLSTAEKIKGAAICLIGIVIAYMAIDNYIKVSNAITNISTCNDKSLLCDLKIRNAMGTEISMPRILEWAYDTLGLIPAVSLQTLLGLALAGHGIYKTRTGK